MIVELVVLAFIPIGVIGTLLVAKHEGKKARKRVRLKFRDNFDLREIDR